MKKLMRKVSDEARKELASTATLVGAGLGLAYLQDPSFYKAVRETIYNARHATRTVGEMIHGTEGQRGVESLLEKNADAQARTEYAAQIAKAEEMRDIYHKNETIGREAERLITQLGGAAAQATKAGDEAANKLTGGFFRKIDDIFMDSVGDAKEARENLPKVTDVYEEFREFYDGREKSEKTAGEFCNYLESKGLKAVAENQKIEGDLNNLIKQVDKTYVVEDKVFSVDDKVNIFKYLAGMGSREPLTQEEVKGLESSVQDYKTGVDETRTSIEQHTGIPAYQNPTAWIDYSVNPLVIGIAGGLLAKGAIDLATLVTGVRKPVRNLLALPFTLAYAGTKTVGKLGYRGAKTAGNFARNKYNNLKARSTAKATEEKNSNSVNEQDTVNLSGYEF